jgi:hypothetical protein
METVKLKLGCRFQELSREQHPTRESSFPPHALRRRHPICHHRGPFARLSVRGIDVRATGMDHVLAFCWTGLLDCGGGFWRVVVSARRVYAGENGAGYFRGDEGFVNGSYVCGRFRGSRTDVEVL